jgi:bifunctional ADP-heptose synthase (sugar kinase/adenylyltransferase)
MLIRREWPAMFLLKKGAGAALITLGGQGALLHTATASVHVPVFSVGKVVDTTGAGDAFNGGFAAALARGETAEAAARFGAAVAGISVTRPGAAVSVPMLAETLRRSWRRVSGQTAASTAPTSRPRQFFNTMRVHDCAEDGAFLGRPDVK